MLNPVTVKLLNSAEKQHRSRQISALQMRKQAEGAISRRPAPFREAIDHLGALLISAGERLRGWKVDQDRTVREGT